MSKVLPREIQDRPELNLRQGIKSSLNKWRELVSSIFLFYKFYSDQSGEKNYCKEVQIAGKKVLEIGDDFASWLENSYPSINDIKELVSKSPLYTAQIEHLQVGLELFLKIAGVNFVNTSLSDSTERTGGNRYAKRLHFSTNIKLVSENILSYDDSTQSKFIASWLKGEDENVISERLKNILLPFTEECQFKMRTANGELFFQQEGVYQGLSDPDNTVVSTDVHEPVGPFRILKSYIKEGMHPYIQDTSEGFKLKSNVNGFAAYADMVKTTLSLIPKRTIFYQETEPKKVITQNLSINAPLQLITYGAPGTGKSHKMDGLTNNPDVVSCVRTTFHPDSDYATFVGAYKPVMNDERIAYEFRPQAFMKAYVRAWQEMAQSDSEGKVKKVVLVIEEINRGNCAQIFGDLFQLLDRGNGGYSTYPIEVDTDLATWLAKDDQLGSKLAALSKPDDIKREDDWNDILSGKKLALPPNLYIWATMNTSDQSLFPIDSAFKRRWDWEYVPIAKPDKSDNPDWKERKIEVGNSLFDWWDFLVAINGHVAKTTDSEDKQLGYFFVKAEDATGCISADTFANKVLFYLYGDVFKSYDLPKDNCFKVGDKVLLFRHFFYSEKTEIEQSDGTKVVKKQGDVKLDVLIDFLNGLKWDGKGVTCEQKSAVVTTTMAGGTSATQDVTTSGGAGMETIAEQ